MAASFRGAVFSCVAGRFADRLIVAFVRRPEPSEAGTEGAGAGHVTDFPGQAAAFLAGDGGVATRAGQGPAVWRRSGAGTASVGLRHAMSEKVNVAAGFF